jgi:transposase-like protein
VSWSCKTFVQESRTSTLVPTVFGLLHFQRRVVSRDPVFDFAVKPRGLGKGSPSRWPTGCGATARGTCLGFMRSQGESHADWEGLLSDLYRRGLEGRQLGLIVTDGCAGLAAAIPTVYPPVRHQCCWVHKMRNILEKVRKRDYDEVKTGAQAIYLAESRAHAEAAFRRFRASWLRDYGPMIRRLEHDLPELLSVFAFPRHLWRKLAHHPRH